MRPGVAVAGIVLIVAGLFIGFGWFSGTTSSANAQLNGPVSSVRIDDNSGSVRIRTGDRPGVSETYHSWFGDPDTGHILDDGELTLGDCGWWCSVDYDVVVPPGTAVSGDADSGDVTLDGVASADISVGSGSAIVRDVRGDVQVDGGSGDVDLRRIGGAVDIDASSGTVRGTGLAGPVTVDASSGDVDLSLTRPASVTADVSSGDVQLRLPDGDYEIDADSGSGSRRVEVPSVPGAANVVEIAASSGGIDITRA